MLRKKRFKKFFIEKIARHEALSLMNRAFLADVAYTFKIKIAILMG